MEMNQQECHAISRVNRGRTGNRYRYLRTGIYMP